MLTRTPLSVDNSIDMLIRQSRSNAKEIVPYQPEILSEWEVKPFSGLSRGNQAILSGLEQIRTIFSGFLLNLLHLMALMLTPLTGCTLAG